MGYGISGRTPQRINTSANTYTELVPAAARQKVVVLNMHLAVAGDVTVTFFSNLAGVRTAIDGPFTMTVANGLRGINLADAVLGVFETEVGASLEIHLSASVQATGNLMYVRG